MFHTSGWNGLPEKRTCLPNESGGSQKRKLFIVISDIKIEESRLEVGAARRNDRAQPLFNSSSLHVRCNCCSTKVEE